MIENIKKNCDFKIILYESDSNNEVISLLLKLSSEIYNVHISNCLEKFTLYKCNVSEKIKDT